MPTNEISARPHLPPSPTPAQIREEREWIERTEEALDSRLRFLQRICRHPNAGRGGSGIGDRETHCPDCGL